MRRRRGTTPATALFPIAFTLLAAAVALSVNGRPLPRWLHGVRQRPFERIGVPTTVPLLAGFLAACVVQVAGGGLLLWPRPSGIVVLVVVLTFLVLAWTVQKSLPPLRGRHAAEASSWSVPWDRDEHAL